MLSISIISIHATALRLAVSRNQAALNFDICNIVLVPVIVIAGDVAGVIVLNVAGSVGVGVPDRFPFAVLVQCTFNLVRRRADAPIKAFRGRPRVTRLTNQVTSGDLMCLHVIYQML